jgi:prolipoprotein diacylglyceryltransferase
MTPLFTIEVTHGWYYALFFFLSFLLGLVILIIEGKKRKFPQVPWLLVITTTFLFFMIGTQFIKFSIEDWQRVLQFKALDHTPGRSVLGGLLLGTVGLLLAKYFFRFRHNVMDAFAWAIPIGMLVQRFGCIMAGCCYGSPTSLPWGIEYGANSYAFSHQVHDKIIPITNSLTLPVHPVPLYEVAGCFVIILILLKFRKHLRAPGNLFAATLGLYAVVRFFTEFFRATSFGDYNPTGLTMVQYVILGLVPLLTTLIIYRENKSIGTSAMVIAKPIPDRHALIYFLMISVLFLLTSRWLTKLEIMTLNLVMLPTLMMISWQVYRSLTVPRLRWATFGLMIGSLLMMSQTLPEASRSDSTRTSYTVFSVGSSISSSEFLLTDFDGTDCNGNPAKMEYSLDNVVQNYGVGFSRVEEKKSGTLQYGIDGYLGTHKEEFQGEVVNSVSISGIHPFLQYDWPKVGAGLGLHAGSLTQFKLPDDGGPYAQTTSIRKLNAFPSLYLRIGEVNKVFWEAKMAQQFPSPFPTLSFQTDIGIGFKKLRGSSIRFGTGSHVGLFVAPTFSFGKHFILENYVGALPGIFSGKSSNSTYEEIKQGPNIGASVSLRYKFGFKKKE